MPITVNKISLKSFKHVDINIDLIEGSNLQRLNTKSTRQLYYTNIGGEEFIVKKGIDTSGKSQNATEVRITKFIEGEQFQKSINPILAYSSKYTYILQRFVPFKVDKISIVKEYYGVNNVLDIPAVKWIMDNFGAVKEDLKKLTSWRIAYDQSIKLVDYGYMGY